VSERLPGQPGPEGLSGTRISAAGGLGRRAEPRKDLCVVRRVDDDGDRGVVLGRGADHGRSPDVDVLDGFVEGGLLGLVGDRGPEGVEVDRDDVDKGDAGAGDGLHVTRVGADREDPSVDPRV
jgi:hypothetical protein